MKLKVYNISGSVVEEIDLKELSSVPNVSKDLFMQYIRVYQVNQRQGTSKTKNKSEVSGGGKKPWAQKGTGRARAGSNRSPLWRGGGRIHGVSPKIYELTINKKMQKKVFKESLSLKVKADKIAALIFDEKEISTKTASSFLNSLGLNAKTLIIQKNNNNLYKSFRNINKVSVVNSSELSSYDVFSNDMVIFEKSALEDLKGRL